MRVAKRAGLSLRLVPALATMALMATLAGFLSSCAGSGTASGGAAPASNVITLNKIDTLKSVFNRDDGHTRLILIFSPT
jgi:hypothetical protein